MGAMKRSSQMPCSLLADFDNTTLTSMTLLFY